MNKLKLQYQKAVLLLGVLVLTWSCSDSWLTPKPLSFYSPENTFVNAEGLQAALVAASANIRNMYATRDNSSNFLGELVFSDIFIQGQTDQAHAHNWDITLMPANGSLGDQAVRVSQWWDEGWAGLNMTNTVISRIDIPNWNSEAERNAVLGAAYFHRAWRYYNLVHQFGDVPWIGNEVNSPRTDFFSYDRWSILERIKDELEFAWEWVPTSAPRGMATKWAAGVLLMKVCLALEEFDRAIAVGQEIVAANPMMTDRFAQSRFTSNSIYGTLSPDAPLNFWGDSERTTLMHDLHSIEGKIAGNNTEGIFHIINDPSGATGAGSASFMMRMVLPRWATGEWTTPGTWAGNMMTDGAVAFDMNARYGRGITMIRPTHFLLYNVWDIPTVQVAQPGGMRERGIPVADIDTDAFRANNRFTNDMRSPLHMQMANAYPGSRAEADQGVGQRRLRRTAWRFPEDMLYNASPANPFFMTNVQRPPQTTDQDYVRSWYHWPHYKTFVPNARRASGAQNQGGVTPWYIYRTPEVYLLMAEAYYWKGDSENARQMLNRVSGRAGAVDLPAGTQITIAHILAERARELFLEEFRKSELTRIAFTYARTGKPCSHFNGRVYRLNNFSGPGGTGANVKQEGINFFYDWVYYANTFMNRGISHPQATYQFSVHHVLWPIPESANNANTNGHLNQNIGYPGAENNIPPRIVPPMN